MENENKKILMKNYKFNLEEFEKNLRGIGYNIYLMKSEKYRNEEQFSKLNEDYKNAFEIYSVVDKPNLNGDFKSNFNCCGKKLIELGNEIDIFKNQVLSGKNFSSKNIEKLLYEDLKKVF